jgi:formamidopyrimidine-DNA glycosylase
VPELAEVEHSRRQWNPGIGRRVAAVELQRTDSRIFRGAIPEAMIRSLTGSELKSSEARGKQMLFQFSKGRTSHWLGIHLGMRGELRCEREVSFRPAKHDYLVLRMRGGAVLVFEDKRLFGRVRFDTECELPAWWTALPISVLSAEWTAAKMATFLARRKRTPVKTALLMQEQFSGIGNWMADEILWRAGISPERLCGSLAAAETAALYRAVRWVSRTAVKIISDEWTYPATWLFPHRWQVGGNCPRCATALDRAQIGGRTTAWCSQCQRGTSGTDPLHH